jgi:hypothetical protein
LRQAHVVFKRVVHEMPNLREFCVGFRSPLDFFRRSGDPKPWWVKRICRVRGLRTFDLRFEEESFTSDMYRLHYRDHGLGPQIDTCIQVLKQICESSMNDRDTACEKRHTENSYGDELYQKISESIEQILKEKEHEEANMSSDDAESNTESVTESDTDNTDS